MAIYTVHEPPLKRYETTADPERFKFVRDGFSFWAFLLAPLWMLRHRMWLALLGYIILVAALEFALNRVGASGAARVGIALLVSILIGVEAATLRRFTLRRRKWTTVGLVAGDDLEAAERRFFEGWIRRDVTARSSPSAIIAPPRAASASSEVIGLFPHPEPGTQR
jgi:hypothetical protein